MPLLLNRRVLLAALVATAIPLAGCVVVPTPRGAELVALAPPPVRIESPGAPPAAGYLWIGGYWGWLAGRHVWIDGHWEAPRAGYRWVPHAWNRDGRGWHERPGRWERG